MAWILLSGVLGGLYFPLWFLPETAAWALILATPFPSVVQLPLDVLVERGGPAQQATLLAVQAGWVVAMLSVSRWVQSRAERKLVIQGG
jgi:ABC-2 type transport system permease protein